MKEILIDLYKIKDLHSGLGQFSLNFGNQIVQHQPEGYSLNFLVPTGKASLLSDPGRSAEYHNASFVRRYVPFVNKKYEFWHSLYQFPSFIPNPNTKWILTIHDLNFLAEKKVSKAAKYVRRLQHNINRADVVTTISHYTEEQIQKNIDLKGKPVHVIHNGIAANQETGNEKPGFVTKEKFFFTIGIFNWKKNFHVLLPMMKHFPDHQLIIAGTNEGQYGYDIREEIRRQHLEDQVVLPGGISEPDKYWLYAHCEAFLFPSLAEGFGMPVIEAMKAGKPVFISRHTSLPEIGGDKAFYFNNFRDDHMSIEIREKLKLVKKNPEAFEVDMKRYASQFNWSTCISEYIKLYEEVSKLTRK
jgi:glycosyltransferase involved in cell wall biosynthesis